jgi:hypothetical protein
MVGMDDPHDYTHHKCSHTIDSHGQCCLSSSNSMQASTCMARHGIYNKCSYPSLVWQRIIWVI